MITEIVCESFSARMPLMLCNQVGQFWSFVWCYSPFFFSSFKPTGMPWWLWDVCPLQVVLAAFVAVKHHSEGAELKLSLSLIKHHTIKACGLAEVWLCIHLISALDGVERLASCLGSFIHRERVLGTLWIGGWVAPRTGLDTVEKIKKSCLW